MRIKWRSLGILVTLLAGPAAWNGGDAQSIGSPETDAICARVSHAEPPAADLPTAAERRALRNCESEALYYGIGMPADPVKARKCAMMESDDGHNANGADLPYFDGDGMLMMIYANGRGAARRLDVAIHLACGIDNSQAATEARVARLEKYRQTGWTGHDFESCDEATSGVAGGYCSLHKSRLAEADRDVRIARLKRGWTGAQGALFDRVYRSVGKYADVAHEMDCYGGTAQGACELDGQQEDIEDFLERIEALASGKAPSKAARPEDAGGSNAATDSKGFRESLRDLEPSERAAYEANAKETIAARATFERDLVAFAASAFPRLSSHEVRALFADL